MTESIQPQHTITIDTFNKIVTNDDGAKCLRKDVSCTCGWGIDSEVYRAEARARHHALYVHGHATVVYENLVTNF